jgi:sulfoxide reductase heme-binding subunit YedZ
VTSQQALRLVLKPLVFVAALGPVAWLTWAGLTAHLSVNPLSDLTNETGVWALRFLCITLAITPLRRLTGWNWVIRFRRMTGLYAFFYGVLHFLVYTIADRFAGLDFPDGIVAWSTARNLAASVGADIYKRPFITIGFTTLMLMLPLAITSTTGWIRRMGGKRWQALHRLVYVAGITGVVHYYWLVKADVSRPLVYATVVLLLLGFRVYWSRMKALSALRAPHAAPRRA